MKLKVWYLVEGNPRITEELWLVSAEEWVGVVVGEKASSSFLCHKQYKTEALSTLSLVPRKVVSMCHLQDLANRKAIFYDTIAEVMCLEWISLYHARKISTGQISLWEFFDTTQMPIVPSIALSMPFKIRSCTFELLLT